MFQNLVCILDLRLQVLAAVSVHSITVFCDVMPCGVTLAIDVSEEPAAFILRVETLL